MKKLVTSLVAITCASMLLVSCGGKKEKAADDGRLRLPRHLR